MMNISTGGDATCSSCPCETFSPQISNRRGSGTSKADIEKLKRRTDYGKEVRLASVSAHSSTMASSPPSVEAVVVGRALGRPAG